MENKGKKPKRKTHLFLKKIGKNELNDIEMKKVMDTRFFVKESESNKVNWIKVCVTLVHELSLHENLRIDYAISNIYKYINRKMSELLEYSKLNVSGFNLNIWINLGELWNETKRLIKIDTHGMFQNSVDFLVSIIELITFASCSYSFAGFNVAEGLSFIDEHFSGNSLDVVCQLSALRFKLHRKSAVIFPIVRYFLEIELDTSSDISKFLKAMLLVNSLNIKAKKGKSKALELLHKFTMLLVVPPTFVLWAEQNLGLSFTEGATVDDVVEKFTSASLYNAIGKVLPEKLDKTDTEEHQDISNSNSQILSRDKNLSKKDRKKAKTLEAETKSCNVHSTSDSIKLETAISQLKKEKKSKRVELLSGTDSGVKQNMMKKQESEDSAYKQPKGANKRKRKLPLETETNVNEEDANVVKNRKSKLCNAEKDNLRPNHKQNSSSDEIANKKLTLSEDTANKERKKKKRRNPKRKHMLCNENIETDELKRNSNESSSNKLTFDEDRADRKSQASTDCIANIPEDPIKSETKRKRKLCKGKRILPSVPSLDGKNLVADGSEKNSNTILTPCLTLPLTDKNSSITSIENVKKSQNKRRKLKPERPLSPLPSMDNINEDTKSSNKKLILSKALMIDKKSIISTDNITNAENVKIKNKRKRSKEEKIIASAGSNNLDIDESKKRSNESSTDVMTTENVQTKNKKKRRSEKSSTNDKPENKNVNKIKRKNEKAKEKKIVSLSLASSSNLNNSKKQSESLTDSLTNTKNAKKIKRKKSEKKQILLTLGNSYLKKDKAKKQPNQSLTDRITNAGKSKIKNKRNKYIEKQVLPSVDSDESKKESNELSIDNETKAENIKVKQNRKRTQMATTLYLLNNAESIKAYNEYLADISNADNIPNDENARITKKRKISKEKQIFSSIALSGNSNLDIELKKQSNESSTDTLTNAENVGKIKNKRKRPNNKSLLGPYPGQKKIDIDESKKHFYNYSDNKLALPGEIRDKKSVLTDNLGTNAENDEIKIKRKRSKNKTFLASIPSSGDRKLNIEDLKEQPLRAKKRTQKKRRNKKKSETDKTEELEIIKEQQEIEFRPVIDTQDEENIGSDIEILEDTAANIALSPLSQQGDSEADEASGSDSDIVPCDENNRMFTNEETLQYHEYLSKKVETFKNEKLNKRVKEILHNVQSDESSLTEDKTVTNSAINDTDNKQIETSKTNDLLNLDLCYGDDDINDLEVVFATIKRDINKEIDTSILIKNEIQSEKVADKIPLSRKCVTVQEKKTSSENFVSKIFNLYASAEEKDDIQVVYTNEGKEKKEDKTKETSVVPLIEDQEKLATLEKNYFYVSPHKIMELNNDLCSKDTSKSQDDNGDVELQTSNVDIKANESDSFRNTAKKEAKYLESNLIKRKPKTCDDAELLLNKDFKSDSALVAEDHSESNCNQNVSNQTGTNIETEFECNVDFDLKSLGNADLDTDDCLNVDIETKEHESCSKEVEDNLETNIEIENNAETDGGIEENIVFSTETEEIAEAERVSKNVETEERLSSDDETAKNVATDKETEGYVIIDIATEECVITDNATERKIVSDKETEEIVATDNEIEENLVTDNEIEEIVAIDNEIEEIVATDNEIEEIVATDNEIEEIVATDIETEDIVATDIETEDIVATDFETEEIVATDIETEEIVATDIETEEIVATDIETEENMIIDIETEEIVATDNETEEKVIIDNKTKENMIINKETEEIVVIEKETERECENMKSMTCADQDDLNNSSSNVNSTLEDLQLQDSSLKISECIDKKSKTKHISSDHGESLNLDMTCVSDKNFSLTLEESSDEDVFESAKDLSESSDKELGFNQGSKLPHKDASPAAKCCNSDVKLDESLMKSNVKQHLSCMKRKEINVLDKSPVIVKSSASNKSIADTDTHLVYDNKENIVNNEQGEEIEVLSPSHSFRLDGSTEFKENETESELNKSFKKSFNQDLLYTSPKRLRSANKRSVSENNDNSVKNIYNLTPLKVANAALSNEIIISPDVSDEENASRIHKTQLEIEDFEQVISDDHILSKSCVEEEQAVDTNDQNDCVILTPNSRSSLSPQSNKLNEYSSRSPSVPLNSTKKANDESINISPSSQSTIQSSDLTKLIQSPTYSSRISPKSANINDIKEGHMSPNKGLDTKESSKSPSSLSETSNPEASTSVIRRRSLRLGKNLQKDVDSNVKTKTKSELLSPVSEERASINTSNSEVENDVSEERDKVPSPIKTRYQFRKLRVQITPEKVVASPRPRRSSVSSLKLEDEAEESKLLASPVRSRSRRSSLSGTLTPIRRSRRLSGMSEES